jgi:hypothetical protein
MAITYALMWGLRIPMKVPISVSVMAEGGGFRSEYGP